MDWNRTDVVARDSFRLARTHQNHLQGRRETPQTSQEGKFENQLFGALNEVNAQQKQHESLAIQSIIAPDSVDAHDVTVAAAKADLSLRITKNVLDRVIAAYREITSLR